MTWLGRGGDSRDSQGMGDRRWTQTYFLEMASRKLKQKVQKPQGRNALRGLGKTQVGPLNQRSSDKGTGQRIS